LGHTSTRINLVKYSIGSDTLAREEYTLIGDVARTDWMGVGFGTAVLTSFPDAFHPTQAGRAEQLESLQSPSELALLGPLPPNESIALWGELLHALTARLTHTKAGPAAAAHFNASLQPLRARTPPDPFILIPSRMSIVSDARERVQWQECWMT
jgi:hypothetical protein